MKTSFRPRGKRLLLPPSGDDIDQVAVLRATHGEVIRMTAKERTVAIDSLTERGLNGWQIARLLHCSGETVYRRWRARGIWKRADKTCS